MNPIKINSLELENVKRIRAVQLTPTENGLTIIGGDNAQGKTSVLDGIAWALGGNKRKPDNPTRDGAATPAKLHVELSNGIIVERRGKSGALYVTDTTGMKGTQKLLDEFLSQLAIDLPRFMAGTDKERTDALLQTLGIDRELSVLDGKIQTVFDDRRDAARVAKKDKAYADSLPHYEDAPDEPVSITELIQEQQEILARNGENQRKRDRLKEITFEKYRIADEIERLEAQLKDLQARIEERRTSYETVAKDESIALTEAAELHDQSTAEIEASIANIEAINKKVSDNQRWAQAHELAKESESKHKQLDVELTQLRKERVALLDGAPLPLDGLSINDDGALTYKGQTWGDMSGAERLRVSTAIVHATKPECGFVLVDELERLDARQLAEFAAWAEGEGLQVIGTRVAKDDACTVIIEDGRIVGQEATDPVAPNPSSEALEFEPESKPKPEPKSTPTWGGASF